jgi:hypothetical protein
MPNILYKRVRQYAELHDICVDNKCLDYLSVGALKQGELSLASEDYSAVIVLISLSVR